MNSVTRDDIRKALKDRDKKPVLYHLQNNEALVVAVFIIAVTVALISGHLNETTYSALMGSTVGYGIARIFNHVQGKE